jgi:hypothetical protein
MSGIPPGTWGFALAATQKLRHQLERVRIQSVGDGDEFNDIEPAFATYAQCRQTLFLNQQQFEAERRAAAMRLIQNMQNPPPSAQTYQMPSPPP